MASAIRLAVLVAVLLYMAAGICCLIAKKRKVCDLLAWPLGVAGLCANLLTLVLRGILLGRPPLADGGDFVLVFVCLVALAYLLLAKRGALLAAGRFVMPFCALLLLCVLLFMGERLGKAAPLPPSLKSPLLSVHVITAALSYAGFALAAGLAAARLSKHHCDMDGKWTDRVVAASFAMLTLTIVLGAFWAEMAWGSYWSWDPKETWALITWIIYAIYLHRRKAWPGKKADIMLVAGIVVVIFTFFGVNYLLVGLHSYA